ncbi:hypothetical protein G8768_03850 [Pseudoteredinibacter isoporae]|nr:hypothetical protein [Pseudoteredinibacter isoporae]NIB25483.1 hypothetical protein [Pseudoteredinibacter isoporae]
MRILCLLLIAAIASSSSFIVHVLTVEWLPGWIGQQMEGRTISPSWDVRYIAMMTSIEYGVAALLIYHFARDKLLAWGIPLVILFMFALLAATHGALIRQPFMDYIVGNPMQVVLVQNGFKYLIWFLMSVITVLGYEFLHRKFVSKSNNQA